MSTSYTNKHWLRVKALMWTTWISFVAFGYTITVYESIEGNLALAGFFDIAFLVSAVYLCVNISRDQRELATHLSDVTERHWITIGIVSYFTAGMYPIYYVIQRFRKTRHHNRDDTKLRDVIATQLAGSSDTRIGAIKSRLRGGPAYTQSELRTAVVDGTVRARVLSATIERRLSDTDVPIPLPHVSDREATLRDRYELLTERDSDGPEHDPEAVESYLNDARLALQDEAFDAAKRALDEAERSAGPSIEYLLTQARQQTDEADSYQESGDVDEAIEHWKHARSYYERALERAKELDDPMADTIEDALTTVREQLRSNINTQVDRDVHDTLTRAWNGVKKADSLLGQNSVDPDKLDSVYERAVTRYDTALDHPLSL